MKVWVAARYGMGIVGDVIAKGTGAVVGVASLNILQKAFVKTHALYQQYQRYQQQSNLNVLEKAYANWQGPSTSPQQETPLLAHQCIDTITDTVALLAQEGSRIVVREMTAERVEMAFQLTAAAVLGVAVWKLSALGKEWICKGKTVATRRVTINDQRITGREPTTPRAAFQGWSYLPNGMSSDYLYGYDLRTLRESGYPTYEEQGYRDLYTLPVDS